MSATPDGTLADCARTISDLRRELAECKAERDAALAREAATAEVLQVINASPGDLAPVFDAMLQKAMRLCEASFGYLLTYDGEGFLPVADRGHPAFSAWVREQGRIVPEPGTINARIVDGEAVIQVADVASDPFYRGDTEMGRAVLEIGRFRTVLTVALRRDGALRGVIHIYRQEVRPFNERQIALLQNFAAQAVIAMENARLLTETRAALDQQTATAEVLQVINASPGDLNPVFQAMLQRAHTLCEASFGALMTYDGVRFHAVAHQGTPALFREFLASGVRPKPGDPFGRIVEGASLSHIHDLSEIAAKYPGEPLPRTAVDIGGIRTLLVVPLRKDNELLGVITAYRREVRPFTDKQIALLQNFAAQAVIAMENARLLDELRQRQQELRVTFDNMVDGVAMFDEAMRLAAWNRNFQELLQLPDELLVKHPDFDTFIRSLVERGEFGETEPETQIARLRARTGEQYSFERTGPDGTVIEVRHNPIPDGGIVLIYSDITERKHSEAEIKAARDAAEAAYRHLKAAQASLIQAEKMASLGQLTAGIAHEIKNPLNFVNNFAGLSVELLDELKETAGPAISALQDDKRTEIGETINLLRSNLEKITEHGRRADGIVTSMLQHSRGGSGERREVDLNALVDEALNLAYHGARARDQSFDIMLDRDFDTTVCPIDLVPQDITRVLLNLFGNGFYAASAKYRAMGDGVRPVLKVTTCELGEGVEIRVRDNGMGILPEIRDKLFQPFFTTKPTGEGTGLGLSISWDIVTQQHGGSIEFDSHPGEFTECTVRLPRSFGGSQLHAV